jgi:hypothetical protein
MAIDPYYPPKAGDRRWSDFFGSFLEMVTYTADNDFYFKVIDNPRWPAEMYKNKSRWTDLREQP